MFTDQFKAWFYITKRTHADKSAAALFALLIVGCSYLLLAEHILDLSFTDSVPKLQAGHYSNMNDSKYGKTSLGCIEISN